MQEQYEYYMRHCLDLAGEALASGNPPVGALIVFEDTIIGSGIESGKSTGDITNHAEILAIRDACKKGHAQKLHHASMYSTHEPCIMCSYLIRHHKIPRIVYGTSVPHVGGFTSAFKMLATEKVPKWENKPEVISGICLDECNRLNNEFQKIISKS